MVPYTIASREEGKKRIAANKGYLTSLTKNDIEFRMCKCGATLEEFTQFCVDQVMEFTESEVKKLNDLMDCLEKLFIKRGMVIPRRNVTFIKTTMAEECDALAYTHGDEIYLGGKLFNDDLLTIAQTVSHELWHCLSQAYPDLRRQMYKLIGFIIKDRDFELPDSVKEYFITNPDVHHHDSTAMFTLYGRKLECFCAVRTVDHFKPGDKSFFQKLVPVLVLADGSKKYASMFEATDPDSVFGGNTQYTIDPEECMADNFSFAVCYGMNDKEYPNPEIIQGVINIFKE